MNGPLEIIVLLQRLVNMTDEDDWKYGWNMRKMFTTMNFIFWIWPKFMTPTNINFTPKICWCSRLGQVPQPQPRLASLHWLGHLPSLTSLLYKKKKGTKVRRTPDVTLRLMFVIINFGQIQLFSVKFIWSSWFDQVNNPFIAALRYILQLIHFIQLVRNANNLTSKK